MEVVSLHPIDLDLVTSFVAGLEKPDPKVAQNGVHRPTLHDELGRARAGNEAAANRLTAALAISLGKGEPVFSSRPFGLSFWEARVDRSLGMMMRPPSRLMLEAGLDRRAAHAMPVRLDSVLGQMGGAWIPARLVSAAIQSFDEHLERSARRLVEAELDPESAIELMYTALIYANDRKMGLIEAQDIVGPNGESEFGMRIIGPDRKRLPAEMAERIKIAITPPRKPGFFDRLRGKGMPAASTNGQALDVTPTDQSQ